MPKRIDLTGKKFGRLIVLEYAGNMKWLCKCDCGTIKEISGEGLRKKNVQSCGCLCKERHPKRSGGDSNTKLYRRWRSMRNRCNDKNAASYKNYGARGIFVCHEWDTSYLAFKKWALSNGYREELTIERIDNDGPYSPENCRFSSRKEQAYNRRDTRFISINGVKKPAKEWSELCPVSYDAMLCRLNSGWNTQEAVFGENAWARDKKTGRFSRKLKEGERLP